MIDWIVDNKFKENKIDKIDIEKLNLKAKKKLSSIKQFGSSNKLKWKKSEVNSEWETLLKKWKQTEEINVQVLPYEDKKQKTQVEIEVTPYIDIFENLEIKITEKEGEVVVEYRESEKQKSSEETSDKKSNAIQQKNKESNKEQEKINEEKNLAVEKYQEIKELFFEKKLRYFAYFLNKNDKSWLFGVEKDNMFFTNSDIDFKVVKYNNINWFEFFIIVRDSGSVCPFNTTIYESSVLRMLQFTISWKEAKKEIFSDRSQEIDVVAHNLKLNIASMMDFPFYDSFGIGTKCLIFDLSNLAKKPLQGNFSQKSIEENNEEINLLPYICGFYEKTNEKTIFNTLIKSNKFHYTDIFYIILDLAYKLKKKQLEMISHRNEKMVDGNKINLSQIFLKQEKEFHLEPWKILISRFYWYDLSLTEDEKDYTIENREIFFHQKFKKRYEKFVSEAWERYKAFEKETLNMLSTIKIPSRIKEEDLYLLFTILSRTIIINIIRKFNKNVVLYNNKPLDENDFSKREEDFNSKLIERTIAYLLKNISNDLKKEELQKIKNQLIKISTLLSLSYEIWIRPQKEFISLFRILTLTKNYEPKKEKRKVQTEENKNEIEEQELKEKDHGDMDETINSIINAIEEVNDLSEEEIYNEVMSRLFRISKEL